MAKKKVAQESCMFCGEFPCVCSGPVIPPGHAKCTSCDKVLSPAQLALGEKCGRCVRAEKKKDVSEATIKIGDGKPGWHRTKHALNSWDVQCEFFEKDVPVTIQWEILDPDHIDIFLGSVPPGIMKVRVFVP